MGTYRSHQRVSCSLSGRVAVIVRTRNVNHEAGSHGEGDMKNRSIAGLIVAGVVVAGAWTWINRGPDRAEQLKAFQSSYNAGDLDGVIARADHSLDRNGSDIDALLAAATAYAMKGSVGFTEQANGSKAIEYADRVLAVAPNHSEALRIKAYAFEIQEKYDDAHRYYDMAIASNPRNFQALSNKGHAYDLQGNLIEAEKFYRQSLAVNDTGEHALLNISRVYLRQGKYEEAKESLTKLATTSGNNRFKAEAYQNLAEVLRFEMKYGEARAAIERSIELDPAVPQAWVTRGRVRMASFFEGDDGEEVIESDVQVYADKALALNPNQASAYAMLYDIASAKGDVLRRDMYKQKALDALERDITLGQQERQSLRNYLEAEIVVVKDQDAAVDGAASAR